MAPENQPSEKGSIELTNVTMYIECDEVQALVDHLNDSEAGTVTMPNPQTTDGVRPRHFARDSLYETCQDACLPMWACHVWMSFFLVSGSSPCCSLAL